MSKKRIYTQVELEAICKDLQEWLRLEDWKIRINLVDHRTMHTVHGTLDAYSYHKIATVLIPTPETYASVVEPEQDMLQTLIHELLHIHGLSFFPDGEDDAVYKASEFMLNAVADCLCDGYELRKESAENGV